MKERLIKVKVCRFASNPQMFYKVGYLNKRDVKRILGRKPLDFGTRFFSREEEERLPHVLEQKPKPQQIDIFTEGIFSGEWW